MRLSGLFGPETVLALPVTPQGHQEETLRARPFPEPARHFLAVHPAAHFPWPRVIPTAAGDAIGQARASDIARVSRIDRSAELSPCARRC